MMMEALYLGVGCREAVGEKRVQGSDWRAEIGLRPEMKARMKEDSVDWENGDAREVAKMVAVSRKLANCKWI